EWQIIDNNNLNHIVVNNIAGDLLKDYKDVNMVTNYTLSFEGYPQGIYFVQFMYSNGEQKTFKIIKGE
ncbi:MAG: T9SS type A sorting domain-containing protein, partial [Flavobacterium sp.]